MSDVAVRMVDNWRERCPGTIEKKKLIKIGVQKERRLIKRLFRPIKHVIYLLEDTHELWYKNSECAVGVVRMGFSLKRLSQHPSAVPMEFYYEVFMNPGKLVPVDLLRSQDHETLKSLNMTGSKWLLMNDYVISTT